MAKLRIHNTLEKKKEDFIPVDPNHVRMYTCGPTVYNYAHIGNATVSYTHLTLPTNREV